MWMNIEEFQLRYMWYEFMNERFSLDWDEDTILKLSQRTDEGQIDKKLTETSPDELKIATVKTYTDFKRDFLEKEWDKIIRLNFTLKDYIDRLEYEYKVIHEMGYDTYFLIVQDYIMYAKKNKIVVGPWRWSAAGSVLWYLIRITEIDPMEYDLLFERFLNPARISMPDIDTDFEDSERLNILEYCKKKYWVEKVANIWTYMTMAAKASFKDVARTFWVSFTKSNQLSNYIEKHVKDSYENNEEFKNIIDEDESLKKIVEFSSNLEWTVRQLWVHACGIIIAPEDITTYTPIQYPPKPWSKEPDKTRVVTQYDGHYMEDIWLLKMDFLWLRNLSIIKNTIKILKVKAEKDNKQLEAIYEEFFKYYVFEPPIDDEASYKIFQEWDTVWVFQFESDGMRAWLKKLKPTWIDDIIAMVSLYRPGPMEWIPNYIDRKQWVEKITYLPKDLYDELVEKYGKEETDKQRKQIREDLSPFMDVTYWIPIYQEQLMRIVQVMAWFSLGEADLLRRWVGKKIKEVIEQLKIEFVEKSDKFKWYKAEVSTFVYEKMIEPAANYSFNKSHAACYAIIAYQTAYLKAHHPVEFYAALLRSVEENTERFAELVEELKIKWIKIQPVSVNTSFNHMAAVEDSVVVWFLSIKWIWFEVWENIEKEREKNWKYKDLEDFLTRNEKNVNKKTVESLIKSWALDEFGDRWVLIDNVENILNWSKNGQVKKESAWMWLFGEEILGKDPLVLKVDSSHTMTKMQKLWLEYETFWTFISSHPFDGLYNFVKRKYNFVTQILKENYEWDYKILWFVKDIIKAPRYNWIFLVVEDITWTVRFFVKNTPGLHKFDIIVVEWYKRKRPSISKIYKINLEKLIDKLKAKWKYDESLSVAKVRADRNDVISEKKEDKKEENHLRWQENLEPKLNKVDPWINHEWEINQIEEDLETSWELGNQGSCDTNMVQESNEGDVLPGCDVNNNWELKIENKILKQAQDDKQTIQDDKQTNLEWDINKKEEKNVHIWLPDDIETIKKLVQMRKENPKQEEFEVDGVIYKI